VCSLFRGHSSQTIISWYIHKTDLQIWVIFRNLHINIIRKEETLLIKKPILKAKKSASVHSWIKTFIGQGTKAVDIQYFVGQTLPYAIKIQHTYCIRAVNSQFKILKDKVIFQFLVSKVSIT